MREEEARIRRAVVRVQNAYPSGGGAWAKTRFEEWVAAVIDVDADAVTAAVTDLIRDWTDDYGRPPQPGHLRERALTEQRLSLAEKRMVESTETPKGEVAPAWYARLVGACVIRSMRLRGLAVECPPRTVPYLQIADQYEMLPSDMNQLPPLTTDDRVRDAHAEAQRYAEEIDDLEPAGPREYRELVGVGAAPRPIDEPWPKGPLNGGRQ